MKRLIEWVCCPMCGSKTRIKIRSDTELTNFPLYCPKCKREALIKAKDLQLMFPVCISGSREDSFSKLYPL